MLAFITPFNNSSIVLFYETFMKLKTYFRGRMIQETHQCKNQCVNLKGCMTIQISIIQILKLLFKRLYLKKCYTFH